ncbi:MAG: SbcC/MukB-like Walker B domain-containing protein, partial [Parabacteroides sp.]|nr:SbcC/MukB-like Walker B domain-containing protein [Parabacteroides sp.]
TQYNELKTKNEIVIGKRDWIKTDHELTSHLTDAEKALRMANEAVESEEFKQKEELIKDWNATIDARNWMIEAQKAEIVQKKWKKIQEELADRFIELLGGQKQEEQEVKDIISQIEQIDSYLTSEAEKAPVYQHAQTIVSHLETIDQSRIAIEKSQKEIAKEKRSWEETLNPAYEKAKHEVEKAKDLLDKEETNVKAQEDAVTALNLSDLRNKRDAAIELLGKIATAKERIETLSSAKEQQEQIRKTLAERLATLEEKRSALEKMATPIHDAELKMNVRKEVLDKQSDTIHKFASTLRLKLQQGDTCPVCRQKIESELPHEEELAAFVGGLKEDYEAAAEEHKELVDAKVKLEAEIKTESKAYEHGIKAFHEDQSVIHAKQKVKESCKACGIDTVDSTTLSALHTLESSTHTTKRDLEQEITKGEALDTELKRLRKVLEAKRKEVERLSDNVQKAEKALHDCKARIATAETLVQSKMADKDSAELKAGELITSDTWEIDWKESPQEFIKILISLTNEYNRKSQNKQTLVGKLETLQANVKNVADLIAAILTTMPTWNALKESAVVKVDDLIHKANSINTSVVTSQTQLKTAEESWATNIAKLNDFLAQHLHLNIDRLTALNAYTSDDILRAGSLLQKERDTVVAKKTLLDKAKEQKNGHQQKKPEFTEEETWETLVAQIAEYEKQMGEMGEKKGAIYQELKTDKENKVRLGALIEDADKKKADFLKWSNMNKFIGDATGNKFRKIAQSYVLASLIHSANSYMKTLTNRYTLKVTPGTFVISLEDAYQGFVSRAASTISGGESFLVSLSLALALSDIGQHLSVDTLFIDEGFGTLSGEPLQNAIQTLRSLHTKAGRHVGIISHVEELQERIPVQIQVLQEGNNSSSKIRIVPESKP